MTETLSDSRYLEYLKTLPADIKILLGSHRTLGEEIAKAIRSALISFDIGNPPSRHAVSVIHEWAALFRRFPNPTLVRDIRIDEPKSVSGRAVANLEQTLAELQKRQESSK
jgi:hypothetical protein